MTEELKPSEVLERAADLIEPEGRWTTRNLARDAEGRSLGVEGARSSPAATCWCALGALVRISGRTGAATDFLNRVIGNDRGIADFNDHPDRTQPEVVAALRKAAELARSEGR